MSQPRFELSNTVLDSADAQELASFYERLLGWRRTSDEPGWVTLKPSKYGTGLSFQTEPDYVRPTWPSGGDSQQMMIHLDIATEDLTAALSWAIECGANVAEWQPQEDVRVMIDPAGHPFCLFPAEF